MGESNYIVYILECNDGTFYTGITNDLEQRLRQHQLGKASKYTRTRLPVRLRYVEAGTDRSWASQREWQIKRMNRKEKEKLIREGGVPGEDPKKL